MWVSNIYMIKTKRFPFTERENYIIRESVKLFGEDWDLISKRLPGRTPKQIHDRYINYLRDGLRNGPWTYQEDAILIQMYKAIGPKWSKMMINLPGRSGNDIKNRWHKHLLKKICKSMEMDDDKSPTNSKSISDENRNDTISAEICSKNTINDESIDKLHNGYFTECTQTKLNERSLSFINSFELNYKYKQHAQIEQQNINFEKQNSCNISQPNFSNSQHLLEKTNQNERNDINKIQNHVRIVNRVDICKDKRNSKDFIEANKLFDFNSSIFNLDFEMHEFLENFGYQNMDFPWV